MPKKEQEKFRDDAVVIDDQEVRRLAENCLAFRWKLPNEDSFSSELSNIAYEEACTQKAQVVLNSINHTPQMQGFVVSRLMRQVPEWIEVKTEFRTMLSRHDELLQKTADLKQEKVKLEKDLETIESTVEDKMAREKQDFRDAREEAADAESEYANLYEQHGNRHARVVNKWLYISLLGLVGMVEWLINWEAANALFAQPYLAAGIVIVIALAIAAASHEHGTLLKQWSYSVGAYADRQTRSRNLRALIFTSLLFFAAMILVGYMRYKLAYTDLIGSMSVGGSNPFGSTGTMSEVYTAVGMTLMGNVIVWILGAMIAYWLHDNDPDFATARQRQLEARKKYNAWRVRMEKVVRDERDDLNRRIGEIDNRLTSRGNKGKLLVDSCTQVMEHERMLLSRLKHYLDEYLSAYKRILLQVVNKKNPGVVFLSEDGELSSLDYERVKVEMPYSTMEKRLEVEPFIERNLTSRPEEVVS